MRLVTTCCRVGDSMWVTLLLLYSRWYQIFCTKSLWWNQQRWEASLLSILQKTHKRTLTAWQHWKVITSHSVGLRIGTWVHQRHFCVVFARLLCFARATKEINFTLPLSSHIHCCHFQPCPHNLLGYMASLVNLIDSDVLMCGNLKCCERSVIFWWHKELIPF